MGISSFEELTTAKKKEIQALSSSIEEKMSRAGELAVTIASMKNDLEDTQETLADDKTFKRDLDANCARKADEVELRRKTRAEELLAIADTIKILNDDDALELFKKTLPGASSFLEFKGRDERQQVSALLRAARRDRSDRPELNFIVLALQGKKV